MNLMRDSASSGLEMDMTPMIDCVFQLIIFFMLITDLSQMDLEQVYLPKAEVAAADKPDPREIRPVVNITSDGRILVKRVVYYDPLKDDNYQKLEEYLAGVARVMPTEPLDKKNPGSPKVRANPLLIRADQSTPAKYIQRVMEICGSHGIQIWKVELAAKTDNANDSAEPVGVR